MKREEAKLMAQSRDCKCVNGKDRDNNYDECIDKVFDYFEEKLHLLCVTYQLPENPLQWKPNRKFIHTPAQEISIILDKYEATCPLERKEIIDEINARFVERQL